MKFLLDSNSLITPKNIYYPFDLFPSYWRILSEQSRDNKLCLISQVYEELMDAADDDLVKQWIIENYHGEILKTNDVLIVTEWQKILNYIQISDLYNDRAFDSWADRKVADPWIIATAKVFDLTVVSLEERNLNLNTGSPTKSVKIPDICDVFDVPYLNLQDMLRELRISL